MLTIGAALWTTTPPDMPVWAKAFFVVAICLLGIAQLRSGYRERDKHEKEMKAMQSDDHTRFVHTLKEFQAMREASEAHTLALVRLNQIVAIPALNIKKRALELSEALTNFVYARMQKSPGARRMLKLSDIGLARPSLAEIMRQSIEYDNETLELYRKEFYPRVSEIRNGLEHRGHTDLELDNLFASPKTIHDILRVADRVGMLAARLEPYS